MPDEENRLELPTADRQPSPLFDGKVDWDGYLVDSNSVTWMFKVPRDTDTIMDILKFILDVVWHAGIRITPLENLYNIVLSRFDHSSGHPIVISELTNEAFLSAKALLYLAIQRKCLGSKSDKAAFKSISSRHRTISSHYEGNPDLEVTLRIIDHIFGDPEPVYWENLTLTIPHHAWMSHILLYRTWGVLRKGEPLSDDIEEFVSHSLQLNPLPPATIVADCLLIVGLVLGINLHINDLLVADKR